MTTKAQINRLHRRLATQRAGRIAIQRIEIIDPETGAAIDGPPIRGVSQNDTGGNSAAQVRA